MRILFLHGREGGPESTKARWLAAHHGAVTPKLPTADLAGALPVARAALRDHAPDLLVGSSFGGALAVELLAEGSWRGPTVLLAPASHKLGGVGRLPDGARVVLVHGDEDDVVPFSDSEALAATGGAGVRLVRVPGGNHRLHGILDDGTLAAALADVRGG
jgi:pimeloyl-ACP methyl ester carboxylesterase